jgi:competence protein ComEA
MNGFIEKYRNLLIILAVISVISIVFVSKLLNNEEEDDFVPIQDVEEAPSVAVDSQPEEPQTIYADIKGEVNKPGVYELIFGERVKDAVIKAGGFTENADEKQVNLALKVTDEMIIYIPKIGEEPPNPTITSQETTATTNGGTSKNKNKINLNTSSSQELTELPGIGPAKAEAIVEYRETNKQFKTIDDLKEISGIGEKTFEKLKDLITVQ